jgi:hypothetical protein
LGLAKAKRCAYQRFCWSEGSDCGRIIRSRISSGVRGVPDRPARPNQGSLAVDIYGAIEAPLSEEAAGSAGSPGTSDLHNLLRSTHSPWPLRRGRASDQCGRHRCESGRARLEGFECDVFVNLVGHVLLAHTKSYGRYSSGAG